MTHYNLLKTHCGNGHPYSGENLYGSPKSGKRQCRACQSNFMRSQRAAGLPQNDPRHGTDSAYTNWGCRCEKCKRGSFEARRVRTLRYKYGISEEQQNELHARFSAFGCDICGSKRNPRIDHCHKTGVVRGILCAGCNTGLGHLRDSKEAIEKAIGYLNRGKLETVNKTEGRY